MEITINLEYLIATRLSTDEFISLSLIHEGRFKELLWYVRQIGVKEEEIEPYFRTLQDKGWIKIVEEINPKDLSGCLAVREKFITLAAPKEDINFDEIWDLFPESAPTAGGTRPLRAKTSDSQNYRDARKKYLARVKTKAKHDDVLLRLKQEVTSRQDQVAMRYMNNILTWINQFGWEKYEPYKEIVTNGPATRTPGQDVC